MEREIRMAGYDPTGWATAEIQTATIDTIDTIRITQDITDNAGAGHSDGDKDITDNAGAGHSDGDTGDTNEDITYALFDADGDGDTDLGRNDVNGVGNQAIAENIDALNFVYLDQNGTPTTSLAEIRSVQVTILARAERADRGYTNDIMYKNQQGGTIFAPLPGDTYRRKILAAEVKCRNLGLD
jgi:type IV pilus assembly protein PilW